MNPAEIEELFARALDVAAERREAWLAERCGDDAGLLRRVTDLLRAHDDGRSFMESVLPDLAALPAGAPLAGDEKPGDQIGPYKLLQKIGEGGCGVVYMAEQEEPVRRRVALKIIKLGMDTKLVVARFEAERQALARMEHPNIARVLDAGATLSGRPYFVMELVRGLRITDYCDQNHLPTARRLELFTKVCQAIQHAHQKGIIHRDIKPSNILVTLHDGEPVPKVIDFGIAKATQGRLTEQTLFTAFEQFIGTPAYVSPEQAEMSGLDVDTRSDIYSLGVLLYELLTGRTPFNGHDLVDAGLEEMRRRLREQEPPRPSLRLRTLNDTDRTTVARRRGTDAPRLTLALRGDLDWIVMRCLEKDRSRRYESATELAADLQRHLRNEPVTARPPSTAYLLQKLIRRHRLAFGAGLATAGALVLGLVATTTLFVRERAALERARAAEAAAVLEKGRAEMHSANEARLRLEAEFEKRRAQAEVLRREKLSLLMGRTMKDMGLLVALGGDRRAFRDILDQAVSLKRELSDQPEIEAGLDETLGGAYFSMGEYRRAEDMFIDALALRRRTQGEDSPAVAQSLTDLGTVYSGQARWIDAEGCLRDALRIRQQHHGLQHPDVARALSALGWILAQQANLHEAEHMIRLALAQQRLFHGPVHPEVAGTLTRLGAVLTQVGQIKDAEDRLGEALTITRQVAGAESLEAARAITRLAVTMALDQRRLPEALTLYREAFRIQENLTEAGGSGRPAAGDGGRETLRIQREPMAEIESALREGWRITRSQYAKESWEEAFHLALMTWVLLQEKKYDEAEASVRECLAIRLKLRADDWSVFHARHMLGAVRAGQQRPAEAESLLIEGYEGMKARASTIPAFHLPRLGEAVQRIIAFHTAQHRPDDARRWQAEFDRLGAEARQSLLPAAAPQGASGGQTP